MQVHVASWWLLLILGYVAVKRNKGWPGSHLIFVEFNKHGEISANQATMAHEIAPHKKWPAASYFTLSLLLLSARSYSRWLQPVTI